MAFGNLIKNLFGRGAKQATDPEGPLASPPPGAAPKPLPAVPRKSGAMIQRDEILDGRSRIAGYRFVARPLGSEAPPGAEAKALALGNDNLVTFAERRLALVPIDTADWTTANFSQFIAPRTTFLLTTPPPDERPAWITVLEDIKSAGGQVALDGVAATNPAALALADLVVLDFNAYAFEDFERFTKRFLSDHPQLPLAIDGLASWSEHRMCQGLGARYSIGNFAAKPDDEDTGEKLNQSRLVLIEMLNLLRSEADSSQIATAAKRDPGVALKVVGMANSPASGLSEPVGSLEQALLVLGRETLYRWISLAMFRAGTGGGRDEALLELALYRGRFLELVAMEGRSKKESDELYLVGLLSIMDSLLGLPMQKVVEKMNLPATVADVLVHSQGPYSRLLMLLLAVEKGLAPQVTRIAADLSIDLARIEECNCNARAWAEEAL